MKANAEAEVEYKLIHTAKHHHAKHNLKNFRLLVLAFQANHHHTYPISRAIHKLTPPCGIEISFPYNCHKNIC
jgi:hypothetical protein